MFEERFYWKDLEKEIEKPTNLSSDELYKLMGAYYGNVFITDGQGTILYFNEADWRKLGLFRERDIGRNVHDLAKEGVFSRSATDVALKERKSVIVETLTRDGTVLWVQVSPVFNDNDEIIYTVHFCKLRDEILSIKREVAKREQESRHISDVVTRYNESLGNEINFVYQSTIMRNLTDFANKVAKTEDTVLIVGETGVGKEIVARYILVNSNRNDKPFFAVNCAAMPETLIESELFGYAPGAFTGGKKNGSPGLFEVADGGTVFLDEIGELPLLMQAKLLRVIESGEITRIGSSDVKTVDVRIIAATNRNLEQMVIEGTFRKDLFYRLNVLPIEIPPLRNRKEDIPLLIDFFITKYNKQYGAEVEILDEYKNAMMMYSWPGNVRELKNCINRMIVIGEIVGYEKALPAEILQCVKGEIIKENYYDNRDSNTEDVELFDVEKLRDQNLRNMVDDYERSIIEYVMKMCDGNITETAKKLGVHRSFLYRRLDAMKQDKCTVSGRTKTGQ